MGLPRLASSSKSGEAAPLAAAKFTVDDLKTRGAVGVTEATREYRSYLALAPNGEWSRPLRGSPKDTVFVTCLAYGSSGTVLEIGGASLRVADSTAKGYLQLTIGEPGPGGTKWRTPGQLVKVDAFGGAPLAVLPVLTLRLDPTAGVWDLYSQDRLVAAGIPLAEEKGARRFLIRAGSRGAWLCGLVDADENPLFDDANANGIDDAYEKKKRGALLSNAAPAAERAKLAQQWKDDARLRTPKEWTIRRPPPDRLTTPAPAGKP